MAERDEGGRFISSGNPAGRPRGAENKISREVREMLRQALEEEGGVEYLRWAARKKPAAFLSLLGRLLPAEIRASIDHEELTTVIIRDYTGMSRSEALEAHARDSEVSARPNGADGEPPPARVTVEL